MQAKRVTLNFLGKSLYLCLYDAIRSKHQTYHARLKVMCNRLQLLDFQFLFRPA